MIARPYFLLFAALLAPTALACSGSLRIETEAAGVYALDYAAIVAQQPALAGCPVDRLTLHNRGSAVALHVVDDGDGRFGPGDRIEWLGQPLHGPASWFDAYSTVNVYRLGVADAAQARAADVPAPADGAPAALTRRLHLEQENLMIRLNQTLVKPWEEPDYWHWAKLTQVDPQPVDVAFDLPDYAARGTGVHARLNFRGLSNVPLHDAKTPKPIDHRVEVLLGGKTVATLEWDGQDEIVREVELPLAALGAKDNHLFLRVPQRLPPWDAKNALIDVVMFNSIELDYPAGGVVTPDAPALRATGGTPVLQASGAAPVLYGSDGRRYTGRPAGADRWRYAAPPAGTELHPLLAGQTLAPVRLRAISDVDLQHPADGIDYLIVSHARLIDAVQPLAAFHRERGLKVALLDVEDVYDQYNAGIAHPQAIRNLVEDALAHWPAPKPRFLLLVGDASFDIRHKHIDRRNLAKWADRELLTPGQFGDIPSTPYADTPDALPNRNLIPTWQFPSYDGQSASDNHYASVGKDPLHPVLAVGRFPVVEPAEVKAIVDKTINYMHHPEYGAWRRDVMFIADESEFFKSSSDRIAQALETQGFMPDKVYASEKEADNLAHQSAIKDGLNEGRLLVHFIGHGGRYIWRTGPPDLRKNHDLFTLEDVSGLHNGGRLPMVLSMTCYSAPFDNPTEDSIGERFLREPGKGAVAVFAASWRNSPSPDYSRAIIEALMRPGLSVGEAIVAGKSKVQDQTLVETYNLLGDPALVLERPENSLKLERRSGWLGADRIEVQVPEPRFRGGVSASWVDADGNVLARRRFVAQGARFVLPDPGPQAAHASELHVYAGDAEHAYDAIGNLKLAEPDAKPAAPAVQPAQVPPPAAVPQTSAPASAPAAPVAATPAGADRLMRDGFEPPGVRTAAASAQPSGRDAGGAPPQSSRSALRK